MMRVTVCLLVFYCSAVFGQTFLPVTMFGTGVDDNLDNNQRLPVGSNDIHYTLISVSNIPTETPGSAPVPVRDPVDPPNLYPQHLRIQETAPTSEPGEPDPQYLTWTDNLDQPSPFVDHVIQTKVQIPEDGILSTLLILISFQSLDEDFVLDGSWYVNGLQGSPQTQVPNVILGFSPHWKHGENTLQFTVRNTRSFDGNGDPGMSFRIEVFENRINQIERASCVEFEIIDGWKPLPYGFVSLHDAGLRNIVLDAEGQLALTDPKIEFSQTMHYIQDVSHTTVGSPICATIIDCTQAGAGSISAQITNVHDEPALFTRNFVLEEVCSNPGVFFGCIDSEDCEDEIESPHDTSKIQSCFGDELQVTYRDSEYSVWLRCVDTKYWSYEQVSHLLIRDGIARNVAKLEKLKRKIGEVQDILFDSDVNCEDIGQVVNLSPTAISAFDFLQCLGTREENAEDFLLQVTPLMEH
eukprot:TRINITY_DN19841_c0_g1_i1.p1 TRINITY_DN19841_c0_g1~~TRINITY_DN19841_c0_g1_i1.p1  ORF type:complete len:467 (+),score=57.35 TRINITY_DN19841_c0_g1_i1:121-1521(+)